MQTREQNELSKILSEVPKLPEWVKIYELNHHSPSQLNNIDGKWCYEYLFLSQKQRRKIYFGSRADAGTAIAEGLQVIYSDYVWKKDAAENFNKVKVKKIEGKQAPNRAFDVTLDYYNKKFTNHDTEKYQFKDNLERLPGVFHTAVKAFAEINLKGEVESERNVFINLPGCILPCIGRPDFENKTHFIELKTKWRRKGRTVRADGSPAFNYVKLKDQPDAAHVLQTQFYAMATGKKPILCVVNEDSYKIFDDTDPALSSKVREKILKQMTVIARRRERLMARHGGKKTFFMDVEPQFNHMFAWNYLEGNHKEIAEDLWLKS